MRRREYTPLQVRMSQEPVDEKMSQIELWKQQIGEGELYLDTEEYEDYSVDIGIERITDYYDNHGLAIKSCHIRFAKDCVEDRDIRKPVIFMNGFGKCKWLPIMNIVESIDLKC